MTDIGQQYRQPPFVAALYADMLPEYVRARAKDYFAYSIDFLPLAASATQRAAFQVQNDSDFLLIGLAGVWRVPATAVVDGNQAATVEMFSSGSGRLLSNRAMDYLNWFGTAREPMYTPYPKLLERASEFAVTLNNLTAVAFNVRLAFHGFKIFDWPADRTPGGV